MILDLKTLQESSGRVAGRDRVEFEDALGQTVALPCEVDVAYSQTGGSFYLHVRLAASYETTCHSCLEPVTYPLETEFDVVIRRGADRPGPETEEEESGDDYITIGPKETEVSLHSFIHENVVVSIPIRIQCREDCRGLCPGCGTNLNHGECTCAPARDPRWDALRKLSEE